MIDQCDFGRVVDSISCHQVNYIYFSDDQIDIRMNAQWITFTANTA